MVVDGGGVDLPRSKKVSCAAAVAPRLTAVGRRCREEEGVEDEVIACLGRLPDRVLFSDCVH